MCCFDSSAYQNVRPAGKSSNSFRPASERRILNENPNEFTSPPPRKNLIGVGHLLGSNEEKKSPSPVTVTRPTIGRLPSLTDSAMTEDDDSNLNQLLENNKKWVQKKLEKDPHYFEKIGRPQKPKYLYFGCADSRVPANEILGLG